MKIHLNGQLKELESSMSLKSLLDECDVNPFTVVVERNERIIKRAQLEEVLVEEGDRIEIVRFIGGGQ